jgi:hypothetical protein
MIRGLIVLWLMRICVNAQVEIGYLHISGYKASSNLRFDEAFPINTYNK